GDQYILLVVKCEVVIKRTINQPSWENPGKLPTARLAGNSDVMNFIFTGSGFNRVEWGPGSVGIWLSRLRNGTSGNSAP
ncbi:hypothetical protein GBAR_LOCUS14937, partial [Geodia barretti]